MGSKVALKIYEPPTYKVELKKENWGHTSL